MNKVGLLGKNISYSYSKIIHEYIIKKYNLDYEYEIIDTDYLQDYIELLKKGEYVGFNITIPYKEKVLGYIDFLEGDAVEIKAINAIYRDEDEIYGVNTDCLGFTEMIKRNNTVVDKRNIYILGSGGAAKAIYHCLKDYKPTIVSRNNDSKEFKRLINYSNIRCKKNDLIINTTPPNAYDDIISIVGKFGSNCELIDINYNPSPTKLMNHFNKSIDGFQMLVFQAVQAARILYNLEDINLDEIDIIEIRKLI